MGLIDGIIPVVDRRAVVVDIILVRQMATWRVQIVEIEIIFKVEVDFGLLIDGASTITSDYTIPVGVAIARWRPFTSRGTLSFAGARTIPCSFATDSSFAFAGFFTLA